MKKIILLSLVLSFLAGVAHAELVNVTVKWTMADTTGVQGYRMYYSYSPDMSGRMLHSECGTPSLSDGQYTMECTNVNLDLGQLPVYFQVVGYDNTNEAASVPKKVTVLPVKEFSLLTQ